MIYHLIFSLVLILISEYLDRRHNNKFVQTIDGKRYIPVDNKYSWWAQVCAFWAVGEMLIVLLFIFSGNI